MLAFLDDLTIPFENNQAKRDLRLRKVQQKISGCLRAPSGATEFGRIRGYHSSLSRQDTKLPSALESLFAGQPLYPETSPE